MSSNGKFIKIVKIIFLNISYRGKKHLNSRHEILVVVKIFFIKSIASYKFYFVSSKNGFEKNLFRDYPNKIQLMISYYYLNINR